MALSCKKCILNSSLHNSNINDQKCSSQFSISSASKGFDFQFFSCISTFIHNSTKRFCKGPGILIDEPFNKITFKGNFISHFKETKWQQNFRKWVWNKRGDAEEIGKPERCLLPTPLVIILWNNWGVRQQATAFTARDWGLKLITLKEYSSDNFSRCQTKENNYSTQALQTPYP